MADRCDVRSNLLSPFGGKSKKVMQLPIYMIRARYFEKCGIDISKYLPEDGFIELHQCLITDYKYWLPKEIAGNEEFYHLLSSVWKNYYQTQRWEYKHSISYVDKGTSCLEIGCGRGFFLKSIENICKEAVGLEFNTEAICNKVCHSQILNESIQSYANKDIKHDVIFSFQVLEHVTDPLAFISAALQCLKPGGLLIISTPNDDWGPHRRMEDAFNLPPHHMGCFNPMVYEKISRLLNIKLVKKFTQPSDFTLPQYTEKTNSSWIFKLFRKIVRKIGRFVLNVAGEPGHTILVIFEK